MDKVDPRVVKALRYLSNRYADDSRDAALAGGLSPDTCYSINESRENAWEPIKEILEEE